MPDPGDLLGVDDAPGYLRRRGVIGSEESVTVEELTGGVSNVVLAVSSEERAVICKQSLPRLRVSDVWLADRTRILAEADALRLTGELTPAHVPAVLDSDESYCTLSIEHAPAGWIDWKRRLLAGEIDRRIGRLLGHVLARWQNSTRDGAGLSDRLQRYDAFDQLRIDPYHRTVARRHPGQAAAIEAVIAEMAGRRNCLTHGDFSPKNVLVDPHGDGVWVIDFEVAHLGDPAFDVAFLLSHLLLKSLHLPDRLTDLAGCGLDFAAAWGSEVEPALHPGWPAISRQLGCLLLARVDGKSPAEYLGAEARDRAFALGSAMLADPPATAAAIWADREAMP
ncbi:MAG TPA: aminoglycoside phosphotransferase family protein [Mycobacteriales bacterium]|nr:aminoglycoside phosphotransferase family protein [Mycobacteriales bacterium]